MNTKRGPSEEKASGSLGLLDRSRRHLHRRDRPRSARAAASDEASVGESGLCGRRGRGDPPPARARFGRANSGRRNRRRQDGNDGRHQRAARAARRAHAARDHARLSRRARDRLSGAAAHLRARTSSSPSSSIPASSRSTSACSRTARSKPRPILSACAPRSPKRAPDGYDAVAIVFMHAYRYPAHERIVGEDRARARLCARCRKAMSPPRSSSSFRAATRRWSTPISRRSSRATLARCRAISTSSAPARASCS